MADMQLREKMKKVSEAAKHGNQVPERSKRIGLIVFLPLIGCSIVIMLSLTIGLFLNKHLINATLILVIAGLLVYSVDKMMKAHDIEEL